MSICRLARFDERLLAERIAMIETPTERAAHAIHGAVADFILAIGEAKTVEEAWRLHTLLVPLSSVLQYTERKALKRTEELQK